MIDENTSEKSIREGFEKERERKRLTPERRENGGKGASGLRGSPCFCI